MTVTSTAMRMLVLSLLAASLPWTRVEGLSAAQAAPKDDVLKLAGQIKASLASGVSLDESAATRMLAVASGLPASELALKQNVQVLFSQAVWDAALVKALADSAHPDQAEMGLVRTIERWETALRNAKVSPGVSSIGRLQLSLFQFRTGRISAMRDTLDQLADKITGPDVWAGFQALFWNLRGLAEAEISNYALALEYHRQALLLRREAGLPTDEAESLNNLGLLLLRIGDYAAAKPQFEQAIEIYNRLLPELTARKAKNSQDAHVQLSLAKIWEGAAYAQLNLAKAIEGTREFNQAAAMLEELNQPHPERPMPDDLKCVCLNNLALIYYNQGRFQQCTDVLQQSRSLGVKAFEPSHLHLTEIDINLGWAALSTGQPHRAESQFRAALDNLTKHHPDHPRRAEVMGYLARVTLELGHAQAALDLLNDALDRRQKYLLEVLASSLSQRDRLAFIQELRVHPESIAWPGVFDTYLELAPVLKIPAEEQYRRLLGWKGILSRDVSFGQEGAKPDEVRQLAARFAEVRRELRYSDRPSRHDADQQDIERFHALETEANQLKRKLSQLRGTQDPGLAAIVPRDVLAALPPKSALLDIIEVRRYLPRKPGDAVQDDRVYVAFLVISDKSVERIDFTSSAKSVDGSIQQLIVRVAEKKPFSVQAQRVDNLLGRELKAHLPALELLIVAGDGYFHRLPMGVLPGKIKGTYLIEEMAFSTVPSAQSLVAHRKVDHKPSASWLVVGGVDYGKVAQPKWAFLNASLDEAADINQLFQERFSQSTAANQATLIAGKQATKELFCRRLPQCSFVHLATHGSFAEQRTDAYAVFDESAQLDSVLVLAGANADQQHGVDSLLTAEEIGWMDLRNVDLLVLSACQTGLGHVRAGQGVIGLVGALDQAGVGTTVSSLWKVDDQATRQLMESFYRILLQQSSQLSPAEALRKAQLKMIEQQRSENREHPYFWAAWLSNGNPGLIRLSP